MSQARSGPVIAGTWLIGLGVVFLIRQATDRPWAELWPLFVILVGVASLVSTLVGGRLVGGLWGLTWPIAWIVVGGILLASTTGYLGRGPGELIAEYWPWALVIVGAWFLLGAVWPWGPRHAETVVVPLAGAGEGNIRIKFGAGGLTSHVAAPGNLVDGSFRGGALHRNRGGGRVELEQDWGWGFGWFGWMGRGSDWDLGLSGEVPLTLRLDTGASRVRLDLVDLQVRNLELHTGASDTIVRLPRSAGVTSVRAEAGAASLTLEVPTGVAARIRSRMGLGSTDVDEARFPRAGDGYESADYATATNRVDIDVQGGVGTFRVTGTA
ncbi:MAG TPA: hypothetical protein VH720_02585 [Candidatus Limnocylindrales bacterium]|jgi:hypothetical protein